MSTPDRKRRVAVVLLNLGGPAEGKDVRPFLFNLFSDPAIINLPALARYPLAALISGARAKSARANYARMGGSGGSPLLPETQAQAEALSAALAKAQPDWDCQVFIAMRYWKPFSDETAAAVAAFAPDDVVLTPLYPQYSTTTTASSLGAWAKAYRGSGVVRSICCYPTLDALAASHALRIRQVWEAAGSPQPMRLLFSAHGLPQKVVDAGDPYQAQVEATAAAILDKLGPGWDWKICYQSRVGPMKWLGPETLDCIMEASAEGIGVLVSPIAFVSEHVETLVELDHDYAEKSRAAGCPHYLRAATPSAEEGFIDGLSELVQNHVSGAGGLKPGGAWRCGAVLGACPMGAAGKERTG